MSCLHAPPLKDSHPTNLSRNFWKPPLKLILEAADFSVKPLPNGRLELTLSDVMRPALSADGECAEYDTAGAALRLGVSQRAIYNYTRRRKNPLKHRRVGAKYLFNEEDIVDFETPKQETGRTV